MISNTSGALTVEGYLSTPAISLNNVSLQYTLENLLPITDFNSTITSYLLTTAFNNTLTSNLATKANINTPSFVGVVNVNDNKAVNNKQLILYDLGPTEDITTATQFYGWGINASTMRYQVPLGQTHKFYCGTTLSLFMTTNNLTVGSNLWTPGSLFVSSNTTLRSNLSVLGNMSITGQTNIINSTVGGGDVSLALKNYASGTSSLYLSTNNTMNSSIYQNELGNVNFKLNISNTSVLPISLYSNGVVLAGATTNNKLLTLFDPGPSDAPSTATNFYGFGVNSLTLRYQCPQSTHSHKFYLGSTLSYTITSAGKANGSDVRFKSEVQNVTNALDKIMNLQGKTFKMYDNPNRSLGFIAQELIQHVPEAVFVDTSDENNYHFVYYDKLVALMNEGIEELLALVIGLTQRVAALENV